MSCTILRSAIHPQAKLLDGGGLAGDVLLGAFDGDGTVLAVAGVDLQALLVGLQGHLDAGGGGVHAQDLEVRVGRGGEAGAVEDEGGVVALAAGAAAVDERGDVATDLLRGQEVVGGAGRGVQVAGGDEDAVGADGACGVGHGERVVEDGGGFGVDEGAEVPVHVVGEHDGRGGGQRDGDDAAGPGGVITEGVGGDVEHVAGEAGLRFVVEGEGDAVGRVGGDGPVLLVVPDEAAVERVLAVVLVLGNVGGDTVDGEGPILDPADAVSHTVRTPVAKSGPRSPVRIPPDHGSEIRVIGLGVLEIVLRVVISEGHILELAVLVLDVEARQPRAVSEPKSSFVNT
nr:hypothetical protein CFP56_66839 [Quercus suber]